MPEKTLCDLYKHISGFHYNMILSNDIEMIISLKINYFRHVFTHCILWFETPKAKVYQGKNILVQNKLRQNKSGQKKIKPRKCPFLICHITKSNFLAKSASTHSSRHSYDMPLIYSLRDIYLPKYIARRSSMLQKYKHEWTRSYFPNSIYSSWF